MDVELQGIRAKWKRYTIVEFRKFGSEKGKIIV